MDTKKTVAQIKNELDTLGIRYKSTLRKSELRGLLEERTSKTVESQYSPPYTRRKTMKVEQSSVKQMLDIQGSPVNHASAVIAELEDKSDKSEETSVDVLVTPELAPIKEQITENTPPASDKSEQSDKEDQSDNSYHSDKSKQSASDHSASEMSDAEDPLVKLTADIELTPETKIVTRTVTKRRSERILKAKHVACENIIFSDEENVELDGDVGAPETTESDNVSTSSCQNEKLSTHRYTLLKIFIISLLFVLLANAVAYLHVKNPSTLHKIQEQVMSLFERDQSSSDVKSDIKSDN